MHASGNVDGMEDWEMAASEDLPQDEHSFLNRNVPWADATGRLKGKDPAFWLVWFVLCPKTQLWIIEGHNIHLNHPPTAP